MSEEENYECKSYHSISILIILIILDLDHTADIQYYMKSMLFDTYLNICYIRVHAWGNSLEEAFVNTSHAMINYMYERRSVAETFEKELKVEGKMKIFWIHCSFTLWF